MTMSSFYKSLVIPNFDYNAGGIGIWEDLIIDAFKNIAVIKTVKIKPWQMDPSIYSNDDNEYWYASAFITIENWHENQEAIKFRENLTFGRANLNIKYLEQESSKVFLNMN